MAKLNFYEDFADKFPGSELDWPAFGADSPGIQPVTRRHFSVSAQKRTSPRPFGRYPFRNVHIRDVTTLAKNFEIGPTEGAVMPQQGINVLALLKGPERFVFLYDDESADQLLQTLGKYAADPELNFSWYDAATLSQRVRKLREGETNDLSETKNRIRRAA